MRLRKRLNIYPDAIKARAKELVTEIEGDPDYVAIESRVLAYIEARRGTEDDCIDELQVKLVKH